MGGGHGHSHGGGAVAVEPDTSYSTHEAFTKLVLAHIGLMTVAWVFVLPIAVMLSIARSRRLAALGQLVFLATNALGLLFGVIYNASTPDFYPNNAHHKLGWVLTWLLSGYGLVGLLRAYTGEQPSGRVLQADGSARYEPVRDMHELQRLDQDAQEDQFEQARLQQAVQGYRWSRDSGQGTEPESPGELSEHEREKQSGKASPGNGSCSPTANPGHRDAGNSFDDLSMREASRNFAYEHRDDDNDETSNDGDDDSEQGGASFLLRKRNAVDRFVVRNLGRMPLLPKRLVAALDVFYGLIDRTALILGFVAMLTGIATYGGLFQGNQIFTGLAHLIKGGIFFWYGLLVLARAVGSFADLGWAWNVAPTVGDRAGRKRRWRPSAEFVESAVIFAYGSTNVFLERLGERDDPSVWSHGDMEHAAISILFFGGGLCGMLIESGRVREWLSASVSQMPSSSSPSQAAAPATTDPKPNAVSTNPLPATIILLLGMTMSAHEQQTELATRLHGQWGYLFVAAALARGVTYLLVYLSPPRDSSPSRPPSEFVAAFALISGGMLFMTSNGDSVNAMNARRMDATVLFTLASGMAAFLMGWEVLVLAVKGWAVGREQRKSLIRG